MSQFVVTAWFETSMTLFVEVTNQGSEIAPDVHVEWSAQNNSLLPTDGITIDVSELAIHSLSSNPQPLAPGETRKFRLKAQRGAECWLSVFSGNSEVWRIRERELKDRPPKSFRQSRPDHSAPMPMTT
jgi:hypothetical protein